MIDDDYLHRILFDNLVNRIIFDEESGTYALPGVITKEERSALLYVKTQIEKNNIERPSSETKIRNTDSSLPPTPQKEAELKPMGRPSEHLSSKGIEKFLDLSVLQPETLNPELRLGLDFGTAYSKACIIRTTENDEEILDLPLGIYAGEDALEMPVHSSLFIDPDGKLYFGPIAVEKSEEARASGRKIARIDSIKSFLINEDRATIDDSPLSSVCNPTKIEVSKSTLITFYLGYLLFLVKETAFERHKIEVASIPRRANLPSYEFNHREKVISEISVLFSMADVLSVSFVDQWEKGFRLEDVVYLQNWMKTNITEKSPYNEYYPMEPLAVASSRLSSHGLARGNVFLVIDVGAGTTDFSMFEIFANAEKNYVDAKQVAGSDYSIPIAGDALDNILLTFILSQAGIGREHKDYKEIALSLRLDIRDYKERLFKDHKLTYSLPNNSTGNILLGDFMNDQRVKDFSYKLKEARNHALSNIHSSWIRTKISKKNMNRLLPIVLTGGGASLPMTKSLAKGFIELDNQKIGLHLSPAVPRWIEDEYEGELIELYPQMAVAIGSAKKFIIEMSIIQDQFH